MNNSVDHVDDTDIRLPSDADRINTALRYGINPLSKKTVVFCWLDRGLPWEDVKYLSKRRLNLKGSTIRVYRYHWVASVPTGSLLKTGFSPEEGRSEAYRTRLNVPWRCGDFCQ